MGDAVTTQCQLRQFTSNFPFIGERHLEYRPGICARFLEAMVEAALRWQAGLNVIWMLMPLPKLLASLDTTRARRVRIAHVWTHTWTKCSRDRRRRRLSRRKWK